MSLQEPHSLSGLEASERTVLRARNAPDDEEDGFLVCAGPRQAAWVRQGAVHKTWMAPSFLDLTVPPVWDRRKERFVAVVNGNRLLSWDGEEAKLDKVEVALEMQKRRAFDVLELGEGGGGGADLMVVFDDGSAQALAYLERNQAEEYLEETSSLVPEGGKLSCAKVLWRKGRTVLVLQCGAKAGGTSVIMLPVSADPDTGKLELDAERAERFEPSKGEKVVGVVQTLKGPGVLVVDSLQDVSCRLVRQELAEIRFSGLPKVKQGSPIHVAYLDGEFTVVTMVTKDKESSVLFLLSLKYSCVICKSDLAAKNVSGLAVLGNRILVSADGKVLHLQAAELPRSLDSMIGMLGGGGGAGAGGQRGRRQSGGGGSSAVVRRPGSISCSVGLYRTLPRLFKKRDIEGLEKILRSSSSEEIPELLLLASIEFLLKCPDAAFAQDDATAARVRRESLLAAVFRAPLTEPLMTQYLPRLDTETVFGMLDFLDTYFSLCVRDQDSVGEGGGDKEVLFSRLVLWISMILNTHYSDLVVAKDPRAAELVFRLAATVAECEERAAYDAISLMPLVKLMREGKYGVQAVTNRDYCIEIVNL